MTITTLSSRQFNQDASKAKKSAKGGSGAATALVHGMTIVTPNVANFEPTGVPILNQWTSP